MLVHALFAAFVLLALLGDARIFLFVMNRAVFGSHREEKSPWHWLMWTVPPLLLALTALFWPLSRWIERLLTMPVIEHITPDRLEELAWTAALAKVGVAWLFVAAVVGSIWIMERIRANWMPEPPLAGIRTLPAEVVRIRRAHIPFASLQRLGAHNDVYDIEVTHHEVIVDDLPASFDGYRIAFLTDTHVASFVRRAFYREVVAQVQRFDPDLVLFGGDFVTWHRHIPLVADRLLDGLTARDGIFAVMGNHDYWAGLRELPGVRFLTNDRVFLRRGNDVLPLAGIDEVYRGEPDPARAFEGIDDGTPCLAISHHPDVIDLVRRRIDLLLCGHTHGGQIRFPFFGPVVVPSRHEAEYAAGFHRVGPVLMYVSRGIGAIPPLRILCRPEVATFTLRRGSRKE
jgi:predicted MPP superfamily phosphohydrolase